MIPDYVLYALISTALLSVIAGIVVRVVPKKHTHINFILGYFTAIAAGALLGDAFIYLIPKAAHHGWTLPMTIASITGVLLMFLLERMITWRELKNGERRSRRKHAAFTNMFGFTSQSVVDGLVIASGYVMSLPVGIATTLAVTLHQVPQEISNYVILRRAGIKASLANKINILAVFMAFVGAAVALSLPILFNVSLALVAPFTAGVFLYVALANLVPDMMRERSRMALLYQTILFLAGIGIIGLVGYLKHLIGGMD